MPWPVKLRKHVSNHIFLGNARMCNGEKTSDVYLRLHIALLLISRLQRLFLFHVLLFATSWPLVHWHDYLSSIYCARNLTTAKMAIKYLTMNWSGYVLQVACFLCWFSHREKFYDLMVLLAFLFDNFASLGVSFHVFKIFCIHVFFSLDVSERYGRVRIADRCNIQFFSLIQPTHPSVAKIFRLFDC